MRTLLLYQVILEDVVCRLNLTVLVNYTFFPLWSDVWWEASAYEKPVSHYGEIVQ